MRFAVSTVTCRVCNHVTSCTVPRAYTDVQWEATPPEDREIDQAKRGCSPAFARWATCPDHLAGPPDQGLHYSEDALPLCWAVDIIEVPDADLGPEPVLGIVRCDENELAHRPHVWTDDEFPADHMLCHGGAL